MNIEASPQQPKQDNFAGKDRFISFMADVLGVEEESLQDYYSEPEQAVQALEIIGKAKLAAVSTRESSCDVAGVVAKHIGIGREEKLAYSEFYHGFGYASANSACAAAYQYKKRAPKYLASVLPYSDLKDQSLNFSDRPKRNNITRNNGHKLPGPSKSRQKRRSTNTSSGEIRNGVAQDLLDIYFSDIGKHELLTADEEVQLAKQIEAGRAVKEEVKDVTVLTPQQHATLKQADMAFERFVVANQRLVINIAAKFSKRTSMELGELIQEGNLGLHRGVEKFDWRRGYKFSTYATWWIRQAIQRAIASQSRLIRLPVAVHDKSIKVRAAHNRLLTETGQEPTDQELAIATRLTPEQVAAVRNVEPKVSSLDAKVKPSSDSAEMYGFRPDDGPTPEEEVVISQLTAEVHKALNTLDERSRYIIKARYGLNGKKRSRDSLGEELGTSREAIKKIEIRALRRLSQHAPDLRAYVA
ncbi:TPA: sigma-70 family RNA polymerase sigma factor [Candidatus Saccharibacteria bacterium]|nr:sigma-70 family RNA polymerase sigma factor [Candidatus Saccharibacteria bacterium]HIO87753.1 sigma-70 family RNA polymerase sigma factor [Candidatus Saccharibacteria bacterium]